MASIDRQAHLHQIEVRERGICGNSVLPSILDTPPNRAAMPDADPAR